MKNWEMKLSPMHYVVLAKVIRIEIEKMKAEKGNPTLLEDIWKELREQFRSMGWSDRFVIEEELEEAWESKPDYIVLTQEMFEDLIYRMPSYIQEKDKRIYYKDIPIVWE